MTIWSLLLVLAPASWAQTLVAAVLPSSRSVQVGVPATAFATIINAGAATATGCSLSPLTSVAATFDYQTTNPANNQVTGTSNTPVDIPPGAAQSFVFALTPTAPFDATDVQLSFKCANTDAAPVVSGLNTLLLSASATPVADIVVLAATLNNDGIVHIPGAQGTGAFSLATVNVGAGGTIIASANTGNAILPVTLSICQTKPTTGACLTPPAAGVITHIDANETPTFAVFVTGSSDVLFDPANARIFVNFADAVMIPALPPLPTSADQPGGGGQLSLSGDTRGEASVAVETEPPPQRGKGVIDVDTKEFSGTDSTSFTILIAPVNHPDFPGVITWTVDHCEINPVTPGCDQTVNGVKFKVEVLKFPSTAIPNDPRGIIVPVPTLLPILGQGSGSLLVTVTCISERVADFSGHARLEDIGGSGGQRVTHLQVVVDTANFRD